MAFLSKLSTTLAPARLHASATQSMQNAFWAGEPVGWFDQLVASGMSITPELAMTLSAYYGGVTQICYDIATLPLQVFKYRDDGGKDRVRGGVSGLGTGGIGSLVYMLRWQPNGWQTATEFVMGMVAQYLLRGVAYAEIAAAANGSFLGQLLPRHPDRVTPERLPSGRLRYRLAEGAGQTRYLTQDEVFVVRDLSLDGGLSQMGRVQYGAQAIATGLAAEAAAGKFFRSGMTAAKVATYKGEMDEEDEKDLHSSITRFATGVENNFGLMLVPDDVTITNLGIEPEKAQMMLAREWTIREVARQLRMPGSKLGIKDSVAYASQVQAAIDYVISCLRPIAVTFEQAIQRDLILAKDTYFAEFKLEALLRGDPDAQASFIEKLIKVRVMRPSEARLLLNMNPDARLDELSEGDFRPGSTAASGGGQRADRQVLSDRVQIRGLLALEDQATRCVRRERAAVEKLATKHAADVDGWKLALRDFYSEHATFVAETMRVPTSIARAYAAQHGSEFEAKGVVLIDGDAGPQWERYEAGELAALAFADGNTVEDWFDRRLAGSRVAPVTPTPITVNVPVDVAPAPVTVDARTTVESARIDVTTPAVTIAKGAVHNDIHLPPGKKGRKTVSLKRADNGSLSSVVVEES